MPKRVRRRQQAVAVRMHLFEHGHSKHAMSRREQLLKSLDFFKDWSNYLLVTMVAALGWVGAQGAAHLNPAFAKPTIWCLTMSIVFGIFTLALIPLVAEAISDNTKSISEQNSCFYGYGRQRFPLALKWVCWPQHLFFIAGIVLYAAGVAPASSPQ